MIKGRGIIKYRTYVQEKKIKEGDSLIVRENNLEFYVNDNGTLNWANVFTKRVLEKNKKYGDLDNIAPEKILSRKGWYIK